MTADSFLPIHLVASIGVDDTRYRSAYKYSESESEMIQHSLSFTNTNIYLSYMIKTYCFHSSGNVANDTYSIGHISPGNGANDT